MRDEFCTDENFYEEDKENRCRNCHKKMKKRDRYCKYCGTKRGEKAFEPSRNVMVEIYGPKPVEREHVCKKCRYRWNNIVMIDSHICPNCGSDKIIVNETKRRERYRYIPDKGDGRRKW